MDAASSPKKLDNLPITPVIICGGSGTRLWPLSRETRPKQFISFAGLSTFQQVLGRISDDKIFARPIIITHADFRFSVAEQIQQSGIEADIILEPVARDSGPAICAAAEFISRRDPQALLLVLAADHIISDAAKFHKACCEAGAAAAKNFFVTFGVRPTSPSTSYGYIKPGMKFDGLSAFKVDAFVEKPEFETAATYVQNGYLWNSGNFLFRADLLLNEVKRFEPKMDEVVRASVDGITKDLDFLRLPAIFGTVPKKSIDYAVLERTSSAAVIPVDFGWSDIGSWNSLWNELERDGSGNTTNGPTALRDTRNSLVLSDETILTAVVGMDEIVVVSTPDAVLVVPRAQAEKVRDLVATLKAEGRSEAVEHRRIYRPWGYYQRVDAGLRYQVKRIVVIPGGKLSLQKHFHRAEHWVVVKGTAEVTLNDAVSTLHENESIYLPIGSIHRLANLGKIPLEMIEVQVGSYLGEDDIVRLEDIYRRP
jgi:mannose-1-phosphate guanylyltransferase/mannose-6-phosphate isomerase